MSNIFQKISEAARSGFGRRNNSVIGIDIGSTSVKVVQLRKDKGRVILETYGELSVGPYAGKAVGQAAALGADKMAELLNDLFKEANITTRESSISIPLRSSLLVNVEMPYMEEEKLKTVVPIEARKYVPVPISEVALDWWIVPTKEPAPFGQEETEEMLRKNNDIEVLIAAIHNDTLKEYDEIGKKLGLNLSFFEIESFSAIRSSFESDTTSSVAIIDMGATSTKMIIVDYGIAKFSHTINKGSQDITTALSRSLSVDFARAEEIKRKVGLVERLEGESLSPVLSPILEYVFTDANHGIVEYQKKYNRSVGKVILVGGGSLLKGIEELAKKSFDTPVVMGTPFDRVEAPPFLQDILKEVGPVFSVSLGLCLRRIQE